MARILVADDHDLVRETLAAYLEAERVAEVRLASDVAESLALIEGSGPFDLVLVDYNMPSCGHGIIGSLIMSLLNLLISGTIMRLEKYPRRSPFMPMKLMMN